MANVKDYNKFVETQVELKLAEIESDVRYRKDTMEKMELYIKDARKTKGELDYPLGLQGVVREKVDAFNKVRRLQKAIDDVTKMLDGKLSKEDIFKVLNKFGRLIFR